MRSIAAISALLTLLQIPPAAFCSDEFKEALRLFEKQSYGKALETFSKTNLAGEKEAERLYYCALCYLRLGKNAEGTKLLQNISERFPRSQAAALSVKYLQVLPVDGKANESGDGKQEFPEEVSLPFRKTSGGQIAVTALVEGKSMEMLFDTGAEECLLGRNQIVSANLNDAERSRSALLHSVSGPIQVYQVMADIKLGGLRRRLPVCVQDLDMETGILGQPFFKGYSYSIDNQAGLIRLRKDDKKAGTVALDSFAIPFRESGDKLIVQVKINGRITEMCFDTGAFGVCLSKSQAETLDLRVPDTIAEKSRGPNGRTVPAWNLSANVELGAIKKNCPIRVLESEMSYPLLGQNFFGDRSFYIDKSRHEIRFAK